MALLLRRLCLAACLSAACRGAWADPVVVPNPVGALRAGLWTFEAASGSQHFGQYIYASSPAGKRCLRNLTIHTASSNYACSPPLINGPWAKTVECLPNFFEVAALMIDALNSRLDMLEDTCVQMSMNKYDFYGVLNGVDGFGDLADDLIQAVSRPPVKNGFMGYEMVDYWAHHAKAFGLPYIELGLKMLNTDFLPGSKTSTTFGIYTNSAAMLPGVVKRLLPERFSMILDTSRGALEFAGDLRQIARESNKKVVVEAIVASDEELMGHFITEVIQAQLRYVVLVTASSMTYLAKFLCVLWKMGLAGYTQVVTLGAPIEALQGWLVTSCMDWKNPMQSILTLNRLLEGGTVVGMMPKSIPFVDEDYMINSYSGQPGRTQSGSINLLGQPWIDTGLGVQASSICFDDNEGLNKNVLIRSHLHVVLQPSNFTLALTCDSITFLSQSVYMIAFEVARHCPVTSCNFNRYGLGCRMSCACSNASLLMSSGEKLCLFGKATNSEKIWTGTDPAEMRCEGKTCRRSTLAHSTVALGRRMKSYMEDSKAHCPPPYTDQCLGLLVSQLVILIGTATSDGLEANFRAFACIERRYGVAGLEALANYDYRNMTTSAALLDCLKNEVEFDGLIGRINFKYRNSPTPGHTVFNILQSDCSGSAFYGGVFRPDDLTEWYRVWWRQSTQLCEITSLAYPALCPPGTELTKKNFPFGWMPAGSPSVCPAGQSPIPLGRQIESDTPYLTVHSCADCEPGTFSHQADQQLCLPCSLGTFSTAGQMMCRYCPQNTMAADPRADLELLDGRVQRFGAQACVPCPSGFVADTGSVRCTSCVPGRIRPPDAVLCELCPEGTYQKQAGQVNCSDCSGVIRGSWSPRGADTAAECACPIGTYWHGDVCFDCPPELSCAGGMEAPQQMKGFWVDLEDKSDLSIYRCRNGRECPAGPMGTCAPGREGRSCNNCKARHYKQNNGSCGECRGGDVAFMLIACFIFLCLALLGFIFVKDNVEKQQLTMVTLLMTVGQVFMTIQALGAISQLSIDFPEPARTIMEAMSVIVIDLDIFRITCLMLKDNPVTKFALQLIAYPVLLCFLGTAWLIARKFNRELCIDTIFNVNGLLLLGFFITLTLTVLLPFQCMGSPCGVFSMLSNPGVTCWASGEHAALVVLGVFGALLYPVSILTWTIWAVVTQPQRIASGQGIERARRYRFLFNRCRPERYYYGVIYLIRNTLVALVPVVFVRVVSIQVVAMATVIAASAGLQAQLWPWRTGAANLSDLLMALTLTVLLTAAAPLVDTSVQDKEQVLGGLIFCLLMLMVAVGATVIIFSLYRRFKPAVVHHVFLCHHKGGAGVLARFIKMVMTSGTRAHVFLDSDQLEDLELIFDTVRSSTANVVVLMTADVLTRMWCAGEIVTAEQNRVHIVPVELDGFIKVDTDGILKICQVWTEGEKHTLAVFGIQMEMIVKSYESLMMMQVAVLNRHADQTEQEMSILEIARRCKLPNNLMSTVSRYGEAQNPRVLVTGAVSDVEVFSTCMVVQRLIQSQLQVATVVVRDADHIVQVSAAGSASYVLILLSKGMLLDTQFALMLWEIKIARIEIVTASTNDGFQFPSADFYYKIEAEGNEDIIMSFGEESKKALAEAYRSLLRVLALPLTPLGSLGLLEKQVSDISRRFKNFQNVGEDKLDRRSTSRASKMHKQSTAGRFLKDIVKTAEPVKAGSPDPDNFLVVEDRGVPTTFVLEETFYPIDHDDQLRQTV